jgi:hypothetical protein
LSEVLGRQVGQAEFRGGGTDAVAGQLAGRDGRGGEQRASNESFSGWTKTFTDPGRRGLTSHQTRPR